MIQTSVVTGRAAPLRPDTAAAVRAARAAELDARRQLVPAQRSAPAARRMVPARLRISYLMPRTDVGGGARILVEHANRLTALGHELTVLSHQPRPSWIELRAPFQQVPFGVELAEAVPPSDLIVVGYWEQISAARALGMAPVIHFEQGDFHLFEELSADVLAHVTRQLRAADETITVSGTVADVLATRYAVPAKVVHNALDPQVFRAEPDAPPAAGRPYVLCVGWDGNEFKGMATMRRVWSALEADGRDLDLVWVTPRPPQQPMGRVVVAPDQSALADLYRGAAAYICCSRYESFPLPPLEAMACGTPVVSTRNVGVLEYARDGINALLSDVDDADALVTDLRRVLDEPALAGRLRAGGLATSAEFTWDTIMRDLEAFYGEVAAQWSPVPADGWRFDLHDLTFLDPEDEDRLRARAAAASTREIAVPVSFPAFEGHRISRWQVVGTRRHGAPGVSRVFLPARSEAIPTDLPYAKALRQFSSGRYEEALDEFLTTYKRADPTGKAAVARWLTLTLLELGRGDEARDVALGAVEEWPDYGDAHYLHAITSLLADQPVDGASYVQALALLGPSARYDEWFDDTAGLARDRLCTTAAEPAAVPPQQEAPEVLLTQPKPAALQARHEPYFVQQLTVSSALVGLSRATVLGRLLSGKRVLHVGYADWPITDPQQNLHVQLDGVCAQLDGIDPNDDAVAVLQPLVRGRLLTDWADVTDAYDVVLVPEVLEHVADMGQFFQQLDSVDAGTVLITVPDAFSCRAGHFEYDGETFTEVVHPDHNVWFTPYTLYNVITKHTDWTVDGLWFFNGISILAACSKPPRTQPQGAATSRPTPASRP